MKPIKIFYALIIAVGLTTSCKDKDTLLPNSTGTPYEMLVVMEKTEWEGPAGRSLLRVLDSDVPGLPQSEPCFKVSYATPDRFGSIFKPVRNIVIATIDPLGFTQANMKFSKNVWADGQMVLKVNAPDTASFAAYMRQNKQKVIDLFVQNELLKTAKALKKKTNTELNSKLKEHLNVELTIPGDLKDCKIGEGFFWASSRTSNKNIVVYTYPYTDSNVFTEEYLLAKRDSIMKVNIPGGPKGSYMGTQSFYAPDMKAITVDGKYCMEMRGLWEMVNDNMGGPFVSHTRIDEVNQRVVTVEGFVFEPSKNKRTIVRQLEGALYSLKMPEGVVTASN